MTAREEPTQADPKSSEQDSLTTVDKCSYAPTGLEETTNNSERQLMYPDSKVHSTKIPE